MDIIILCSQFAEELKTVTLIDYFQSIKTKNYDNLNIFML